MQNDLQRLGLLSEGPRDRDCSKSSKQLHNKIDEGLI
jgi:hypothetical protein